MESRWFCGVCRSIQPELRARPRNRLYETKSIEALGESIESKILRAVCFRRSLKIGVSSGLVARGYPSQVKGAGPPDSGWGHT